EGIYAVVQLTANASATVELDRQLKLSEAVMRTKVLRAEEAIAQVAEATKLAEEKAARKAANPSKPAAVGTAPAATPAAAPTEAPVEERPARVAKAKVAPAAEVEATEEAEA
ncbi:MAG TPA: hypothetical protein VHU90_11795, partial [Galbitalea sp.]|nr:hypothetical protein [Galbitalea sp.]